MAYGDKMSGLATPPDPLDVALRPPENESDEDRKARLSAEEEAKKVSDMIDEELKAQERAEKRGAKPIKILLLGELCAASIVPVAESSVAQVRVNRVGVLNVAGPVSDIDAMVVVRRQVDDVEE